ncbi:nickel-dependent hydrogenase large subunit [Persephonella sp.]
MGKITVNVLHRVEGEVQLKLIWDKKKVKDAYVMYLNLRGYENILKEKPVLDAVVIAPRVCGICSHAHLNAVVSAIEDIYLKNDIPIKLTEKAKLLREITQMSEIVLNHIRWFYLNIMPDFIKLEKYKRGLSIYKPLKGEKWKKGLYISNNLNKLIAIFSGQWPHTSYVLPGGVTSDPTIYDISSGVSLIDSVIKFFEEEILHGSYEKYLSSEKFEDIYENFKKGDLGTFLSLSIKHKLDKVGSSYGRHISKSGIYFSKKQRDKFYKNQNLNLKKIKEIDSFSFFNKNSDKPYSWSKSVRYNGLPFETGPLSRLLISKNKLFTNLLNQIGESYMLRVWGRLDEIIRISLMIKEKLLKLKTEEKSFIKPSKKIDKIEGKGFGVVEAPRGLLIHQISVKDGKIKEYNIITPSSWNLGPRCEKYLSPAEKALIGLTKRIYPEMILRSFDVCASCATH